jgi:hypothetical protein
VNLFFASKKYLCKKKQTKMNQKAKLTEIGILNQYGKEHFGMVQKCKSDNDCSNSYMCVNEICVEKCPPGGKCTTSEQVKRNGFFCDYTKCFPLKIGEAGCQFTVVNGKAQGVGCETGGKCESKQNAIGSTLLNICMRDPDYKAPAGPAPPAIAPPAIAPPAIAPPPPAPERPTHSQQNLGVFTLVFAIVLITLLAGGIFAVIFFMKKRNNK